MRYLKSISLIVVVSLLSGMLRHSIAHTNLSMLYILVVVISAIRWGRGPSIVSALLSVLIFDFFFVPPQFSMTVADTQYLIAFATLFVVAMAISSLALKAKQQAKAAKNREMQTLALYNLSKDLSNITDIDTLHNVAIRHVQKAFDAKASILVKDSESSDLDAALVSEASVRNLSLRTAKEEYGVLKVEFKGNKLFSTTEQFRLLESFTSQISFAIERLKLSKEAHEAKLLREAEKLHTAFLNSVSHDLRTPLASVSGSLSSILQNPRLDEESKNSLVKTAYDESVRLNLLVADLLDMARVNAGALHIAKSPTDIKDLVGATLKYVEQRLSNCSVTVDIPADLPEVGIDFVFMMKALANVFDNAAKYSRDRKEIKIAADVKDGMLEIAISDRGIGIPPSDLKQVFDKFYRVRKPNGYEGTGLGLSVSKGIVEAHGGKIWAQNREKGGTTITIHLPLFLGDKNDRKQKSERIESSYCR
ncbi:MAG: DUF4118 domain-containing protein [Candidatus Omnitrophica bacterium]|nr:DUF4118 domain-containing protein [Candidatus Omnitrophota bacterium]